MSRASSVNFSRKATRVWPLNSNGTFSTFNATQKMTLEDGTVLSPALGIGAFVEKTLVAAGQSLVLTGDRAAELGLARQTVEHFDQLKAVYGISEEPPVAQPHRGATSSVTNSPTWSRHRRPRLRCSMPRR